MSEMFEQCRALMESMMSGAGSWMSGMMPMGGGMMLFGVVWVTTLLVASGVAIAWLILRGRGRHTIIDPPQILDVRYARGELDRETYLRMRADLTDDALTAR